MSSTSQQQTHAGRARLAALYLIAIAVAVFLLDDWRILSATCLLQLVVGIAVWRSAKPVLRTLRKLGLFAALVLISYTFVGVGGDAERMISIPVWPHALSLDGLAFGGVMLTRIFTVVLASGWVRLLAGPRGFAQGLSSLGLPSSFAELLDGTLSLLEGEPALRKGRGDGSGGGRGRRRGGRGEGRGGGREEAEPGIEIRRLIRGDTQVFVDLVERSVRRARRSQEGDRSSDYSLLSGLLLLMLSIKALKIVPGLPFAPGHKGVVLIPTYLLAAALTSRRWGATLLGSTFGTVSFLMGDGKYGIFEVFKHIAPGVLADALAPLLRRTRSVWVYAMVGMVLAAARWGAIAAVVFLVGAPAAVVAMLTPIALVHLAFGAASGVVTSALLRGGERILAAASGEERNSSLNDRDVAS